MSSDTPLVDEASHNFKKPKVVDSRDGVVYTVRSKTISLPFSVSQTLDINVVEETDFRRQLRKLLAVP